MAVANKKGASGSPSIAVNHFTLFYVYIYLIICITLLIRNMSGGGIIVNCHYIFQGVGSHRELLLYMHGYVIKINFVDLLYSKYLTSK